MMKIDMSTLTHRGCYTPGLLHTDTHWDVIPEMIKEEEGK